MPKKNPRRRRPKAAGPTTKALIHERALSKARKAAALRAKGMSWEQVAKRTTYANGSRARQQVQALVPAREA